MTVRRLRVQLDRLSRFAFLGVIALNVGVLIALGIDAYFDLLSVEAIVVALLSLAATVFMVGLVLEENALAREAGHALGWTRLTLTRVLTIGTVAVQLFALYVGFLAFYRLAGLPPIPWTPAVSATGFVGMECVPLLFAGYLRRLRNRNEARRGRREPPPYGDLED